MISTRSGKVLGMEVISPNQDLIILESIVSPSPSSPSDKQLNLGKIFCFEKLALKNQVISFPSEIDLMKSSSTYLCAIGSSALYVYSTKDYELLNTFKDLWEFPAFSVASLAIVYSTSTPIKKLENREDQELFLMDSDFLSKTSSEKATEIASKVASGVGYVGELGLKTVQNYFASDEKGDPSGEHKKVFDIQDGVLLLRNLAKPDSPGIAHWKPHKHPISHVVFNSSQTLIYTCSTIGKTICAWSILNCFSPQSKGQSTIEPTCIMTFARGYTTAMITDLTPSLDDRWLSISTSRGTAHLYNIEPKFIAAAFRLNPGFLTAAIPVSIRINSRNPLQVVRSLFPQSPDSLGSSPAHMNKPSSFVDHATADLGYEEMTLDTVRNVFSVKFGISKKYKDETRAKYPLLLYDPFGKVTITMIEPVFGTSKYTASMKSDGKDVSRNSGSTEKMVLIKVWMII